MKQSIETKGKPGKNLSASSGIAQVSRKNLSRLPLFKSENIMVNGGVESRHAGDVPTVEMQIGGQSKIWRDGCYRPIISENGPITSWQNNPVAGVAPGSLTIFKKNQVGCYLRSKTAWWVPPLRLAVNLYFTARLQSIKRLQKDK
ncbi:MAG: hypothetical protein KKC03_13975 [Bacteroidetes bacterium]|nr:hypothetical protein [Bacteroidota bacterium]